MTTPELAPPASEIAAELRTPLAVIAGYAELLRVREDPGTRLEAADRILEAAKRLSALVDDLLQSVGTSGAASGELDNELRLAVSRARLRSWSHGRHGDDAEVPSRDCRILLVDDDADLRDLLRTTLPVDGFEVLEARDGDDALREVRAAPTPPDLVVLDWNMPRRSGAAVLEELHREHPELPVIVLTGDSAPSQRALATSLGARTFLAKPFSPLELIDAIEKLLPQCV